MKRTVGLVVAIVVVLGVAGFVAVRAFGASAPQPTPKTHTAANVKVATTTKTYSMTAAGLKRSYEVIAPAKGLPAKAPIIVFLSGIGASVPQEVNRDDLVPYVSSDQAELVYPVGFDESWNAITCCGEAATHNVNDVAFLEALVPKVDPGHKRPIYLIGFSNGARLGYRLICDDPELFNEYAMVKGEPTNGCELRKPVTILQLASENDPEVPYKPGDHGSVETLPMTTLVTQLHTLEKCPTKPTTTHSGSMTLTTWSGCMDGTRLAFGVWPDGEHNYPRPPAVSAPAASQVIWSFFTKTPIAPLPK
jgi:polyhydroxybutyrate depolymerase